MPAINCQMEHGPSSTNSIIGPDSQDHEEPLCAITSDKMEDPVRILNSNGRFENELYERSALKNWLEINPTSPITRLAVKEIVTEKPLCGLPIDKIKDPVQIINSQGQLEEQVYERASLDYWLQSNSNHSPATKLEIKEIVETKLPYDIKILRTAKKIGITALKILGSLALTLICTASYAIVGAAIGALVIEAVAAFTAIALAAIIFCAIIFLIAALGPSIGPSNPHPTPAPAPCPSPSPSINALPLKLAKGGAIAGAVIGGALGLYIGINVSKNLFWKGQDLFSEENKNIFFLRG